MHNLACHYAKKPDLTSALSWLEIELYYATGAVAMEQVSKPAWRFWFGWFLAAFSFLISDPCSLFAHLFSWNERWKFMYWLSTKSFRRWAISIHQHVCRCICTAEIQHNVLKTPFNLDFRLELLVFKYPKPSSRVIPLFPWYVDTWCVYLELYIYIIYVCIDMMQVIRV